MIRALLFDYGGTLDTAACHWYYVLRRGYEVCHLRFVDHLLRDAYVYGERALARYPIIQPHDDFYSLLQKKVDQEFQWLEKEGWLRFVSSDKPAVTSAEVAEDCNQHRYILNESRLDKVEAIATWCDTFARRHAQESAQVLEQLAGRFQLVLVSNFYGNLRAVVDAYGLGRFFPTIIESATVGVRKPDPEIWRMAVRAAGCAPEEAVAIGDSFGKDIKAAQAAGCQTIWFKGREWKPTTYDHNLPTHVITNLTQLLPLLLP